MTKKIKLIKIFFNNILNYGFCNSMLILIHEIYNIFLTLSFKDLEFNDDATSDYNLTKLRNKKYNVPYIPTPFFFLSLIKRQLIKNNFKKFTLIDIGCGYVRVGKYLNKYFKIIYYGIEINKDIYSYIKNKNKNKNFIFFNFNVRNSKKTLSTFKNISKKNKINILFISDTLDLRSLKLIINKISINNNISYLIMVNTDSDKFSFKNFYIVKKISFTKSNRNIIFYKKKYYKNGSNN
jgi:hypothetical protein